MVSQIGVFMVDFFIKNGYMSSAVEPLGNTLSLNLGAITLLEKKNLHAE